MCPALVSEALVLCLIPLNERLLLLKRTETLPGLDKNEDPLCWYLLDTIFYMESLCILYENSPGKNPSLECLYINQFSQQHNDARN